MFIIIFETTIVFKILSKNRKAANSCIVVLKLSEFRTETVVLDIDTNVLTIIILALSFVCNGV